jgi:hypothetical protein
VPPKLIAAAATKAIVIQVSASRSPPSMPTSIARPSRYGGASAAAVASVSATNIRITRPR